MRELAHDTHKTADIAQYPNIQNANAGQVCQFLGIREVVFVPISTPSMSSIDRQTSKVTYHLVHSIKFPLVIGLEIIKKKIQKTTDTSKIYRL